MYSKLLEQKKFFIVAIMRNSLSLVAVALLAWVTTGHDWLKVAVTVATGTLAILKVYADWRDLREHQQ